MGEPTESSPGPGEPVAGIGEQAEEPTVRATEPPPTVAAVQPVRARRSIDSTAVRWWIAVLVTILVAAAAVWVAAVAGAGTAASPTVAYVPSDALAYMELRLDLPGDQRDQATRFLGHFPSLLDPSTLTIKVARALDGFVGDATQGRFDYSTDLAPWIAGPAAVAVLPATPDSSQPARVGILVAVKDRAKAEAFLDRVRAIAAQRAPVSSQEVQGTTVWTVSLDQVQGFPMLTAASYALTSDMLIVTERPGDVGAFLDAKAGTVQNLGDAATYREASAEAPADRLGSAYVDAMGMARLALASLPAADTAILPSDLLGRLPSYVFATLRVESDRIVLDGRSAALPAESLPPVRTSPLVDHVPASALVYAEGRDVGQAITAALRGLLAQPSVKSQLGGLAQIEPFLGTKAESFFDWIGDAGIAILPPADASGVPTGGLVATVTDSSTATTRIGLVRTALAFAGSQVGIQVSEERHGSVLITTLDVSALARSAAGPGSSTPIPQPLLISFALDNGRFILGLGPEFVRAVLDTPAGGDLGGSPAFRDALGAAGGPATAGFAYVDVSALRGVIEHLAVPEAGRQSFETNVQPYLIPFDRIVVAAGVDGDRLTKRAILILGQP